MADKGSLCETIGYTGVLGDAQSCGSGRMTKKMNFKLEAKQPD